MEALKLTVEIGREDDGRWTAGVAEVSGAAAYGETPEKAAHEALAIAFVALALDEGGRSGAFARLRARVHELLADGALSAADSERMLHYMRRDTPDLVMDAWLANPVGPIPWGPLYRMHPDDEADLLAASADTRSVTLAPEEVDEWVASPNGEYPPAAQARIDAMLAECPDEA